ncbi:MAG: hypothetical protein LPK80_04300, partial [Bacteroidota bacterium]|nr:hypothetical protein [Bacteroidota bacterium]MDX5428286.1 hypothetical protein [Bacteroidota bacterium]MDX5506070.1 hypothetical protein [Bacteroidota bacterium]
RIFRPNDIHEGVDLGLMLMRHYNSFLKDSKRLFTRAKVNEILNLKSTFLTGKSDFSCTFPP